MNRTAKQQAEIALVVLKNLFGSGKSLTIIILIVFFLLSLGWFTNATYALIIDWFTDSTNWLKNWKINMGLASVFPMLLFIFIIYARFASSHLTVKVHQNKKPCKVKGLILFLSPCKDKEKFIDMILQEEYKHNLLNLDEDSKKELFFQNSWRMPFEAIAYHLSTLEYIVIIPSTKTYCLISDFKTVLRHLLPEQYNQLAVKSNGKFDKKDFPTGVDFEDMEASVEVIHEAYQFLLNQKIRNTEILIDITGGQKTTTIAGAAIALDAGRQFQYVSTQDYKVRTYDVTYLGG